MKFLGAVIAYLAIAFILGWGILLAADGSYWLLAIGALIYIIAFARIGCLPPKDRH